MDEARKGEIALIVVKCLLSKNGEKFALKVLKALLKDQGVNDTGYYRGNLSRLLRQCGIPKHEASGFAGKIIREVAKDPTNLRENAPTSNKTSR